MKHDSPYTLRRENGSSESQPLPLGATNPITIGRHTENTIALDDQRLSRHHARLTIRDGALFIIDLGSANGTRVNGEPLNGERQIWPGDTLDLGGVLLRVEALETFAVDANMPTPDAAPTQLATPVPGPAPTTVPGAPNSPYNPAYSAPIIPTHTSSERPASRSRLPLVIGGLGAAFLVFCVCIGAFGLLVSSRGDDASAEQEKTPTTAAITSSGGKGGAPTAAPRNGSAGGAPTVPLPSSGTGGAATATQPGNRAAQPTSRPAQQTGGANGVARGDYLCQAFTTVGLATVGGIHIVTDTTLTYSVDDKPLPGATQYTYAYDATTGAIRFIGGPYDGRQGSYNPASKVIQVSLSVGCTWQR